MTLRGNTDHGPLSLTVSRKVRVGSGGSCFVLFSMNVFSALHGCLDVTDALLGRCDYGVDVKDSCGTTPLMDALRAGYLDVAQLLIEKQKVWQNAIERAFCGITGVKAC